MNNAFNKVPVVILCGGKGIVLNEESNQRINKGLIPVQQRPLVWWVLLHYALYGARDFLLAVGLQIDEFRAALIDRCEARLDPSEAECYLLDMQGRSCRIRLVTTAVEATTAERLLECKAYLHAAERFALAYSDTLSDVDLGAEMAFHQSQKLTATLVGTQYPVRFRILGMRQGESIIRAFAPRPVIDAATINGGYYIFTKAIWEERFGLAKDVALENQPLEKLAALGELGAYLHKGGWQHCDAERDLVGINALARQLSPPVGS